MRIQPRRKLRPRQIPGFVYTGPKIRRNLREKILETTDTNQSENLSPRADTAEVDELNHSQESQGNDEKPTDENKADLVEEALAENNQDNENSNPPQNLSNTNREELQQDENLQRRDSPIDQDEIPDKDKNEESLDDLLSKIYRYKESPTAYSSALKNFIDSTYSLSVHKKIKRKFRRRPFIVYQPGEAIQADLVFYTAPDVYRANSFYKYILVVIDMFSRKAYAEPLKTKNSIEVAGALDKIIGKMPYVPRRLMVDAGTEFSGSSNGIYNTVVRKYKIVIYVLTDSMTKAAIVERFNRALRERIARYMTDHNTKRWIDVLPEIIASYNNTEHSSLGMPPNLVSFRNAKEVFAKLYPNHALKVKCHYKVGWKCRIPRKKSILEKGYTPNWSDEIFTISKIEQVF